MKILAVGAVAPLALAAGAGLDGLLPQKLGNVLMRALLVPAQVDKAVRVPDDALPVVLKKSLQLGDIL